MKKVRKFSNGGMDDYDSSDDAKNLITAAEREASEAAPKPAPKAEPVSAPPMKMASFKEAFAEARKAGDKTFEWMGKKYTTELASDKKRAPAASIPTPSIAEGRTATSMPREARGVADTRTAGQKYAARQEAASTKMGGAYRDAVGDLKRGLKDLMSTNPRLRRERASMQDIDSNFKAGGKVSSASKRADGCAIRGKTRGRMM